MKNVIISMALVLFALPVCATTYEWIDDAGTVNFTEDYGKIPKKYRKKAKVLGEEDAGQTPKSETKEEPKRREKGAESVETKNEAPSGSQEKKRVLYGGKEEESWKSEFRKVNADLKAAEEQLAETKNRLNETSKMSRSEYLALQHTTNAVENRIVELKKKLESLNQAAAKAGVPPAILK